MSAVTPAIASACLNAPDAIAGLLRAKAKRDWLSLSVDHLAGDHLKMPLVLAVPAADVAAIKPNNDGFGRPRRRRLRRCRNIRLHNGLADPHGSVPHRARVRRPTDRQQLRQQVCDLAKRRQRRIPRRHIGQFGRHGCGLEVEGGEALCLARPLAGTGEQAPNPDWDVAEQRAERRDVMSLAGQPTPASRAGAAMLTGDRHLCRDDLRLDRGGQLLRLCETEPEVGQARLLIAFEACDLHLRRLAGPKLRHQLDPPHQFRHPLTLVP